MPASRALKNFKTLWADACKSMWLEVAALRHLEATLRGDYAKISAGAVLTDWIYAPECRNRIGDTKDVVLEQIPRFITSAATSRIVLLAAGFEAYFEEFLEEYLKHRAKYFSSNALTSAGNKSKGEIIKCRGPVARIDALATWTTAKIATIQPDLPILNDVYLLRNTLAHDAGIVDARTASEVKSVPVIAGQPLRVTTENLVSVLAPPIRRIAEALDDKIHPK